MLSVGLLDKKRISTEYHLVPQQVAAITRLRRLTSFKRSSPDFSLGATQTQIKNDPRKLESIHFVFVNPLMCR